jgi:TRAP-type mannitol/chloroaromatic compound transport system permease small subunit
MRTAVRSILGGVDALSTWSAKGIAWACFVMVLVIAYDVVLRYLFRAPTVWQYDVSYMLGGSIIILGAGYVHQQRKHVRVDILYNSFSPRTRLVIDVCFTLLCFFPLVSGLIYASAQHAIHAYRVLEFSEVGFWRPRMWPFRSVIPIGLGVLWLQGLANLVRDLHRLVRGEEL